MGDPIVLTLRVLFCCDLLAVPDSCRSDSRQLLALLDMMQSLWRRLQHRALQVFSYWIPQQPTICANQDNRCALDAAHAWQVASADLLTPFAQAAAL